MLNRRKNIVRWHDADELIEMFYSSAEAILKNTDHCKRITMVDHLKKIVDTAFYQIEEGVGVK